MLLIKMVRENHSIKSLCFLLKIFMAINRKCCEFEVVNKDGEVFHGEINHLCSKILMQFSFDNNQFKITFSIVSKIHF